MSARPHGVAVSVSPCRGEGPGSTPGGGACQSGRSVASACERKIRYETQLAAFKAIGEMRAKGRTGRLRAHRCRSCRGYHLTSRPRVWSGKQWHVGWA